MSKTGVITALLDPHETIVLMLDQCISDIAIVADCIVYIAQIILSQGVGGWQARLNTNKANLSPAKLKLS